MDFPDREQKVKQAQKLLNITVDGDAGMQTWTAIKDFMGVGAQYSTIPSIIKETQKLLGLVEDAKDGPNTWNKILEVLGAKKPQIIVPSSGKYKDWPKANAAEISRFYGEKGENQVLIDLPYPMVLAWDTKIVIHRMSCHKKCAESFKAMFQDILDHYGIKEIERLGLNKFGGCLNVRKMRGGSEWSHHSWGAVIDIDPENNQLKWGKTKAFLARPEYKAFWDIVYSYGMTGLGPEKNYDFMHFGCINYRK